MGQANSFYIAAVVILVALPACFITKISGYTILTSGLSNIYREKYFICFCRNFFLQSLRMRGKITLFQAFNGLLLVGHIFFEGDQNGKKSHKQKI